MRADAPPEIRLAWGGKDDPGAHRTEQALKGRVIGAVGQRPAVKAELAVADQADAVRGRLEQELKLLRPLLRDRAQRSARRFSKRR